jgi:hypothetical protein
VDYQEPNKCFILEYEKKTTAFGPIISATRIFIRTGYKTPAG